MISYSRNSQSVVATSSVKIVGLGGAGSNVIERIALEGIEGTELVVLNTNIRSLSTSMARDKIQLGANLTRGLGAGGDPDLGQQAALEAETEIRAALKDAKIVFICAGLGGGTGSGATPIVTRIAREEGAFVVVFATTPFKFEGRRRQEQADTALNELAVLSNALVTFDNDRMGELIVAKNGIHEAFLAADRMICESIKAIIRLVVRPGLIHIGLDDLISALSTNRSRCLFGSGIADGSDRAIKALNNALSSPLLDKGTLLNKTKTILVHLCGGESLSLFEIETLMQQLQKHVPEQSHILFGAAIDPSMGDSISVTMFSSLPDESNLDSYPEVAVKQSTPTPTQAPAPVNTPEPSPEPPPLPTPTEEEAPTRTHTAVFHSVISEDPTPETPEPSPLPQASEPAPSPSSEKRPATNTSSFHTIPRVTPASPSSLAERNTSPIATRPPKFSKTGPVSPAPRPLSEIFGPATGPQSSSTPIPDLPPAVAPHESDDSPQKLKLGVKNPTPSDELSLDSTPRGRFDGASPNVLDGEDLDLPPFLRVKR